jgi:hypothetical protein
VWQQPLAANLHPTVRPPDCLQKKLGQTWNSIQNGAEDLGNDIADAIGGIFG